MSHLYNTFSITIVPIERFIIHTIKQTFSLVDDASLLGQAKIFCWQEANHSAIHNNYNGALLDAHYPKLRLVGETWLDNFSQWIAPSVSLQQRLLFVVFLGIFSTYISMEFFQRWNNKPSQLDPRIGKLFSSHAVEEVEHRSLSFDLFEQSIMKSPMQNNA